MSIEEQIDDVIKDWQGSRDSMHWSPESPEPVKGREPQWHAATEPAVQITLDNSLGRFEPGGRVDFASDGVDPDAPIRWPLAPDEIKLLRSIKRDHSWWRRLARWIRRSGP